MAERWQDEERYGGGYESRRGEYGGRYEDDYERGSDRYDEPRSRRGFASMDPEEHRQISREGGRMSHGGERGRDWDYGDDRERRSFREPDEGAWSRRGFASMDPEEQRRIASMGGRASHGGQGRDWNYDDDRERRSFRVPDEGGRSRRGFAAMDPEEQRRIASMGGRASHGGRGREGDDDDDRFRSRGSSMSSGGSRRGFAAMDPEEQREIARMGGRASHEYGRGHEFTPEEAREAGRKGGQARWR